MVSNKCPVSGKLDRFRDIISYHNNGTTLSKHFDLNFKCLYIAQKPARC